MLCALWLGSAAQAQTPVYSFSVLNQRSPSLTAQYWNPILAYVSKKSDVELRLKIGKTAAETTALTVRGEAQFAYTNRLFAPARMQLGWRVIARPNTDGVHGQLVVNDASPTRRIAALQGMPVAFPSAEAVIAYQVAMHGDHGQSLFRAGGHHPRRATGLRDDAQRRRGKSNSGARRGLAATERRQRFCAGGRWRI
jgi:ABC-type phosphate/phosphonate transport system substrate-binding protein